MKKMKKFSGTLGTLALTVLLAASANMQVKADEYSYRIKVFAGKQGSFENSGEKVEVPNVTEVTFKAAVFDEDGNEKEPAKVTIGETPYSVEPVDGSKYYVKGIRESGRDKTVDSFTSVDKDKDFVIAYGVKKDMVPYIARYVDAAGNEFARDIFMGNVGDKPVVAYRNIEGYVPNAYNITGTLKAIPEGEENPNVFTFTYTPIGTGGGGGGGDRTVYDEEIVNTTNTTPVIVPGAGGDAAGAAGGGVAVVPRDGDAADAGAAGAGDAGEAAAPEEPEQLIDLDDEEVPLANVPGSNGGGLGIGSEPGSFFVNLPPAVIVGVVSMAVLVVAAAWYLLFMRKKKGTGEDGQE